MLFMVTQISIVKDGKVEVAIEEERLTRIKHWAGFPEKSISACLNFQDLNLRI